MNQKTIEALTELAKAAARSQGLDENNVQFSVCRPKTTCLICHAVYEVEVMEEPCPNCGAGFSSQIFDEELKEVGLEYKTNKRVTSDDDDSEHWLCNCGAYIEDGYHCPNCNGEPPWGCPCSFCQDGDYDDEDDEVDYYGVTREDWDYGDPV